MASQLYRYSPAVFAISGLAAVGSIYLLYTTYSRQSENSTPLHRSNAVHRSRAERHIPSIGIIPAFPHTPLGTMIIQRGDRTLEVDLRTVPFPSRTELAATMGSINEDIYRELVSQAIHSILQDLSASQRSRGRLGRLNGLPEALASRGQGVLAAQSIIASAFPSADHSLLLNAFVDLVGNIVEGDQDGGEMANFLGLERGERPNSDSDGSDFAETEFNAAPEEPTEGLKGLLYYIAQDDARRKAYEHRGIRCEECGECPIRNTRFHCLNCPDFDLCTVCEGQSLHPKTHIFAKIKIPLPVLSQPIKQYPIWYPGDPQKVYSSLGPNAKKQLSQRSGFDEQAIDALYDQFTCIANVPWAAGDPAKVQLAIDRRAFNQALTSERWPQRYAPNAVYDRMFAFYDEDNNGLIGFEEFISGLAYLRGPKRFASIHRALQGFDLDGDGCIDRADMLRLLKAKYVIQCQLVSDMVEGHETEQTEHAVDVLRSSQPISSIFNQEEIPRGEFRPRTGKQLDTFGDMRPLPGTKTILDDADPWPRDDRIRHKDSNLATPQDRLRNHISRFEEMLYGSGDTPGPALSLAEQEEARSQTEVAALSRPWPLQASPSADDGGQDSPRAEESERPHDADALWEIVEAGFNELLDPMFKAKELEHGDVIKTRAERSTWRAEIEQALETKRAFQEELQSAALVDPLMATAMKSYPAVRVEKKLDQTQQRSGQQAQNPAFRGNIVPTDAQSLARREAEIAQRPLEDLLNATGYGVLESEAHNISEAAKTQGQAAVATEVSSLAKPELSEGSADPMLPQNRPNASPSPLEATVASHTVQSDTKATAELNPPSMQRLEYLALLDDAERNMESRGGVGRLNFLEIEGIVEADTTKELRGLVTGWLEWASF